MGRPTKNHDPPLTTRWELHCAGYRADVAGRFSYPVLLPSATGSRSLRQGLSMSTALTVSGNQ